MPYKYTQINVTSATVKLFGNGAVAEGDKSKAITLLNHEVIK